MFIVIQLNVQILYILAVDWYWC